MEGNDTLDERGVERAVARIMTEDGAKEGAQPDAAPDASPPEAVGMVDAPKNPGTWFRKQADQAGNGVHSYSVRPFKKDGAWTCQAKKSWVSNNPKVSSVGSDVGTFTTARAAIAALQADGMRVGVPEVGRQRTERSSSRLNDSWTGSLSPAPLAQSNDAPTTPKKQASPAAATYRSNNTSRSLGEPLRDLPVPRYPANSTRKQETDRKVAGVFAAKCLGTHRATAPVAGGMIG